MAAEPQNVSEEDKSRSVRMAAYAVAGVAAFAIAFVALCSALGAFADSQQHSDSLQLSVVEHKDPFYVLLIGSDSRKGTALYTGKASDHAQLDQHADVITLVRVDPANYQITLVTVPRDTVLPGESSKINDTLVRGDPMETVDAVERLTGVEVDYYLMTTFTAFEDLVDALGGVTVDVPKTVKVPDPSTAENVTVTKGDNQTLDGSEALVFARARKEYVNDQDAVRQVNVRQLEQSIIRNVLGMSSESEIDQALIDLRRNTTSNMDMGKLGYLAMDFAMHENDVVLYSCTGPYSGDVNSSGLWVVNADTEAWGQLMDVVSSGGDPSGIVAEPAMP